MTLHDVSYAQMITAQKGTVDMDTAFEQAVDDATNQLLRDEYGCVYQSVSYAYEVLINSLSISLDLMMDKEGQQRLELFLPMIAVVDENGLYVSYLSAKDEFSNQLQRVWSDCIPYETDYENKHYRFYLSGTAQCTTKEGEEAVVVTLGALELLRKEVIATTIEKTISQYIMLHNRIAKAYGITYEFQIPAENNALYSRAITSPSLLVLFQGYPFQGTDEVYQSFAFNGASIKKRNYYLITKKDWYLLYHKSDCKTVSKEDGETTGDEVICNTKEECASYGAFPCPSCVDLNEDYSYLTD